MSYQVPVTNNEKNAHHCWWLDNEHSIFWWVEKKKKPVTRQSPKKEAKEVYKKMEEDLEAMFAGKLLFLQAKS